MEKEKEKILKSIERLAKTKECLLVIQENLEMQDYGTAFMESDVQILVAKVSIEMQNRTRELLSNPLSSFNNKIDSKLLVFLEKAGVYTLGKLRSYSLGELKKLDGFGKRKEIALERFFKSIGLSLEKTPANS